MKGETHTPPWLAQWLLGRVVRGEDAFAVLGDHAEEFGLLAHKQGRTMARRWYWQQLRHAAIPNGWRRLDWSIGMLKNDLKTSFRALRRNPLFTLINLTGLAVGLAAFTVMALFVLYETGYDRFHPKLDRLYRLSMRFDWNGEWVDLAMSPPGYATAMAESSPLIQDYARLMPYGTRRVAVGDVVHSESMMFADPGVFRLFNFPLIKGDLETLFQANYRAALSASLAKKYFGDTDPIGQTLMVDDNPVVVEAVFADVPRQSHLRPEFLISMHTLIQGQSEDFGSSNFYTYFELAPDATPEAVVREAKDWVARRGQEFATRLEPFLEPVKEIYLHSTARYSSGPLGDIKLVQLFSAIAFFVLLMAGMNFINMATARSGRRAKEVAVRKVLGSRRQTLVRQFLLESTLLAVAGLGLSQVLVALALPHFNQVAQMRLSLAGGLAAGLGPILLVATLGIGLLAGAYPALVISGFKPVKALRGRMHTGGQSKLRRVLVVLQFGISIALVFVSLMVARQTAFMKHRDPGFQKENVVTIGLSSTSIRKQADVIKAALLDEPAVVSASLASRQMGSVYGGWSLIDPKGEKHSITALFADEDYVKTLGFRMAAGRALDKDRLVDQQGYLLNEAAARLMGGPAIVGQEVAIPNVGPGPVVGVIADFNFRSMHEAPEPLVIRRPPDLYQSRYLTVRLAQGQAEAGVEAIQRVWKRFEPNESADVVFLDDHLDSLYWKEERTHAIVLDFAGLAVFIGGLGLLGLAAYAAERRRKEVAIRKVMGASVRQVVVSLCKEFVLLVGIAALWAWPAAWLLSMRWLQQFAYRVKPDGLILAGSAGAALLAALLAVGFQAVKAAWANPVKALKDE